jgi:pectin methylesterase-like acyl-CoA thioesterase
VTRVDPIKKQQVIRWTLCPLALAWVAHARGATIVVPTDQPTIQAAVDAASPGDTIRVQPGSYQESVRIRGAKTGLTIEAADATDPPTIHGTANKSGDGIRVDSVNGVIFRNLRLVGAYDGVRLNSVRNAILVGLDIENSALGIRVNHGQGTIVDRCIVLGTRLEQGILVASAPGTLIRGSTIGDTRTVRVSAWRALRGWFSRTTS